MTHSTGVNDVLETAWQELADHWDEQARHDALFALVTTHASFAWAAAKYKTRAGDAIADKQLAKIRRGAEAALYVSATPKPDTAKKPYQSTIAILALMIVLIITGLVYAVFFYHRP